MQEKSIVGSQFLRKILLFRSIFIRVNCGTIIEKIRCDYVHRRSPGGRLRGCCGERGRFGRGLGVVEGRQDGGQRRIRRLARRHLHLHLRLRLLRLRRYCVRRRTETMRACSSEIHSKKRKKYVIRDIYELS